MNVTLPEKEKLRKRSKIIYGTIILVCIVSLIVAFYVQFYTRINFSRLLGINNDIRYGNKTQEEIEELKTGMLEIFNNNIEKNDEVSVKKEDESNDIVYTYYEKRDIAAEDYDIEVHIPKINIEYHYLRKQNVSYFIFH